MALGLQRVERERDVMRGDLRCRRGTAPPAASGNDRPARRAKSARLCRQAIHRVRLVERPRHQRRERQLHALRAVALEDKGVERIEGLEGLLEARVEGMVENMPPFGAPD